MKNLYKKYNGMLMTFPDDATKEMIAEYKNSGRRLELRQYDEDTFNSLLKQAEGYLFREIRYVDGEKTKDSHCCTFTPENMVIFRGRLYAVRFISPCAVGSNHYVIPLSKMRKGPCLASSHIDRYDDYGDHDSWKVDTYIQMESTVVKK